MSWDYAKDKRTDEQVKADYDLGKKMEEETLKRIGITYFMVNSEDEFKNLSEYTPDAFIRTKTCWMPAEVKYSRCELTYVELKKNQAEKLISVGGVYIHGTPTKYAVMAILSLSSDVKTVVGYCNKPCYRISNVDWKLYPQFSI